MNNFEYNPVFKEDSNERKDLKELYFFANPKKNFDEVEEELERITIKELNKKINELVKIILIKNEYEDSCN